MMEDIYVGFSYVVAKDYKPKWTFWRRTTVSTDVRNHKRKQRRIYKHYLKTGDIRDFNRSQRKITRWDFD